ncbi:hypothetical protein KCM76_08700 [Zooshikella marina]|uniref:Uncharacterized protein n=1 Tax=Zooshikella ganghwensis TaxID=202772 RepID=A0A4P9VRU0_9GAMM|nr:hypothetical protein [Zooshikella ganghwensis]MBU2706061.1 hypothetical protein [Zooshikella ganghwensis]RDH46318.1 hypothetical protein B9G39_24300 [Zooshikella ganghwensis]
MKYLLTSLLIIYLNSMISPALAKNDKHHDNYNSLPPGLQKNVNRGKPLPPGWQKKLGKGDILDDSIYVRGKVVVPLGRDGAITINVDGTFIKLYEHTREIIDIF